MFRASRASLRHALSYGAPVAAVILAVALRHFAVGINDGILFGIFTLAIIFSAWTGGLWLGIFATMLFVLAGIFLFLTRAVPSLSVAAIFFINGCLISLVCESFRLSLRRAETARKEAEQLAVLKDGLLVSVSHEMRTPLTAMLGWVQLLRQGSLSGDTIPQALETIERNARAQAKLFDDFLDMSRILSGRLQLDIQCVNLVKIVEAAVTTAQPAATAKNILLVSIPTPRSIVISGDASRLQQIIWHLLDNAIKFTSPHGKITVAIEPADSQARISVMDTGAGIAPKFLPHIFGRFRQQGASSAHRQGIGLSLVKQLVELHGGTVGAQSAGPGSGSVFVVSLPLIAQSSGIPESTASLSEAAGAERDIPSLLGTRILVVDDDSDARELLRSILAQRGASVRTAASAAEAIRQFELRCPDVLVSDIGMPGQDGYELIRSIRARDPKTGGLTPALALTAFAHLDDRRRAIGAGFHMHLSKPVEPAELVTVVASLAHR